MVRLFALMASLLLLLGATAELVSPEVVPLSFDVAEDCSCCPEDGAADGVDAEGDCCDWDFGACCATAPVVALSVTAGPPSELTPALAERPILRPLHLVRPRDNGPPPTPPPIG